MKHNKKTAIALLCAATMAMSTTAFSMPCMAAATTSEKSTKKEFVPNLVTNKLSVNKDIRFIANNVNLYAASVFGNKKVNMKKLTASKKLEIASYAGAGVNGKELDAKDTIKGGSMIRVKDAAVTAAYKKLFNETVNLSSAKANNKFFVAKGGKCYVKSGDWGEGIPVATIDSILQTSPDSYEIVLSSDYKNINSNLIYYKQANIAVTVKKEKNAYGVTAIEYAPTNMEAASDETMEKFAPIIRDLKKGDGYAFAKTNDGKDILFVADSTYNYDLATRASIGAKIYTINAAGAAVFCGSAESAGTSYPIAMSKDHAYIFAGSGHCVYKYAVNPEQTTLTEVEKAEETFDTNGTATYTYNGEAVADDSALTRLFSEWLENSQFVDFITVE